MRQPQEVEDDDDDEGSEVADAAAEPLMGDDALKMNVMKKKVDAVRLIICCKHTQCLNNIFLIVVICFNLLCM